ncbi:MAG: Nitrogen regulation protein [Planctomycetota bacterium]
MINGTSSSRSRSLFRLLVLPVVGLVIAAVVANVAFAAWLAARRSLATARRSQEQVAAALEGSRVALSQPVLDTLRRLTGSEFVVWNEATGTIGLTTLAAETLSGHDPAVLAAAAGHEVRLAGRRYHVGKARSRGVRPETVLVLAPVGDLVRSTLEAVWPVLAVAAATLAVLIPLGFIATSRLARRLTAVERHVARIAAGHFGERLADSFQQGRDDIGRLVAGVNHLSDTLSSLRANLVAGERQRLLGQLAAGFAHELRNAVTGARLAIDLHRRRCQGPAGDASLGVATKQLDILAEEVQGLLALGRPGESATAAATIDLAALFEEVADLVGPRAEHAGVRLAVEPPPPEALLVGRREAVRAAIVNLVLNAIDAAGRDGEVRLAVEVADRRLSFTVDDDGPGPPPGLAPTITDPFVSSKPEGVGLGLAVAKAVAEEHGGKLSWSRAGGRTRFAIILPPAHNGVRNTREPDA